MCQGLKCITTPLSFLPSPLQTAESTKEESVVPGIGCEDVIAKLIETAAPAEDSCICRGTLEW